MLFFFRSRTFFSQYLSVGTINFSYTSIFTCAPIHFFVINFFISSNNLNLLFFMFLTSAFTSPLIAIVAVIYLNLSNSFSISVFYFHPFLRSYTSALFSFLLSFVTSFNHKLLKLVTRRLKLTLGRLSSIIYKEWLTQYPAFIMFIQLQNSVMLFHLFPFIISYRSNN